VAEMQAPIRARGETKNWFFWHDFTD
jgi:hypothetical protein